MDETAEYKKLAKEYSDLSNSIKNIVTPKKGDDPLGHMKKELIKMPPGSLISRRVDELRERTDKFIDDATRARKDNFSSVMKEYLENARKNNKNVKEKSDGWRVDILEFKAKPAESKISVYYNGELVMNWTLIKTFKDIQRIENDVFKLMRKYEIPKQYLIDAVWVGYNTALTAYKTEKPHSKDSNVPIISFLREFQIALYRNQLRKLYGGKVKYFDLPAWTILYNIDRYKMMINDVPNDKKVYFVSGSQHITSQTGKSVILDGLSPEQSPRRLAYVSRRV